MSGVRTSPKDEVHGGWVLLAVVIALLFLIGFVYLCYKLLVLISGFVL